MDALSPFFGEQKLPSSPARPDSDELFFARGGSQQRERLFSIGRLNSTSSLSAHSFLPFFLFNQPTAQQVKRVRCESSGVLVPKDKAVKRFIVRNIVDASAVRDLQVRKGGGREERKEEEGRERRETEREEFFSTLTSKYSKKK